MQAGFVGFGIFSGITAALLAIGAGAGVAVALVVYSCTGALAVLGAALPWAPDDHLTHG